MHGSLATKRVALGDVGGIVFQHAHAIVSHGVPPSQTAAVAEMILELQHIVGRDSVPGSRAQTAGSSDSGQSHESSSRNSARERAKSAALNDRLERCIEALYEESLSHKLAGAQALRELAFEPTNLPAISKHATLLGALVRILREDGKRSAELATAVLQVLYCFSVFSDFHAVLMQNRAGDACFRAFELEVRRRMSRQEDLRRFEKLAELQARGDTPGEAAFRAEDEARIAQLGSRAPSSAPASSDVDETASGPGRPASLANGRKDLVLMPLPKGHVDASKERLRTTALTRKQDPAIRLCMAILRNLADDVSTERKLCSRGIVTFLIPLVQLDSPGVAAAAASFLLKLSIFEENKDMMAVAQLHKLLLPLLPTASQTASSGSSRAGDAPFEPPAVIDVHLAILRLLYNLCFDSSLCSAIVAEGAVMQAAFLLRDAPYRAASLKLLYQMSQEPEVRAAFAASDALQLILKLAIAFPQGRLPLELAGLLINLSLDARSAALMLDGSLTSAKGDSPMKLLIVRATRTGDPMVLKILRGLAWFTYNVQVEAHDRVAADEEATFVQLASAERRRERMMARRQAMAHGSGEGPHLDAHTDEDSGGADDNDDDDVIDFGLMPDEPVEYEYEYSGLWAPHVREIVRLALTASSNDVLVESIGILSCLTPTDLSSSSLSWASYSRDPGFIDMLTHALTCPPLPRDENDDVVLAALQLVAMLSLDPGIADFVAASAIPGRLSVVLAERRNDTDMMLQCCCAVGRLLHHHSSREALVAVDQSSLPLRLVELLGHSHEAVVAEATDCMYIVLDTLALIRGPDSPLMHHLKSRRFNLLSRDWLSVVAEDEAREREQEKERSRAQSAAAGRARLGELAEEFDDADVREGPPRPRLHAQASARPATRPGSRRESSRVDQGGSGTAATAGPSQHPSAVAAAAYRRMGMEAIARCDGDGGTTGGRGGLHDDDVTGPGARARHGFRQNVDFGVGNDGDSYLSDAGSDDHDDEGEKHLFYPSQEELRPLSPVVHDGSLAVRDLMDNFQMTPRTGMLDPRPGTAPRRSGAGAESARPGTAHATGAGLGGINGDRAQQTRSPPLTTTTASTTSAWPRPPSGRR